MKDILKVIAMMFLILVSSFITFDIITSTTRKDDEYIKILKQSLNEQIQEKQVYMNMLKNQ